MDVLLDTTPKCVLLHYLLEVAIFLLMGTCPITLANKVLVKVLEDGSHHLKRAFKVKVKVLVLASLSYLKLRFSFYIKD